MIVSSIEVSLEGLELGISGAVPDVQDWNEPVQDRAILEFVAILSGLVIKYGGRVVHGAHPSFTPVILRQAHLHRGDDAKKPVTIFMSDLWGKDLSNLERARMEAVAELEIVPVTMVDGSEVEVRNSALTSMRMAMLNNVNSLVAVGGKVHRGTGIVPGVGEEISLAQQRGMACFLVGGFGGMASELARIVNVNDFRNGLAAEYNELLLSSSDIASSINIIFSHLAHMPDVFGRGLKILKQ